MDVGMLKLHHFAARRALPARLQLTWFTTHEDAGKLEGELFRAPSVMADEQVRVRKAVVANGRVQYLFCRFLSDDAGQHVR
jgi:hypothetical protein